jgi:hypothetical protein
MLAMQGAKPRPRSPPSLARRRAPLLDLNHVIERVVDGSLVVIAKAHCDDGRLFDAIQHNEIEEFEINECTPTEQAC